MNEFIRCSRPVCEDRRANRSINDVIGYFKCHVFVECVYLSLPSSLRRPSIAKMVGQIVVQYVMYLTNEFIYRCRRLCEDGWENRSMNDVITYKKCHVFDE